MTPSRHTITLDNGQKIVYTDNGPKRGEILVAVHGFRGSDSGLDTVLAPLIKENKYRIVSFNIPGMGVSPVKDGKGYDLDTLVELLIKFIRQIQGEKQRRVVLMGHSFGTTIVSAAAARYPNFMKQIILLSPIARAEARRRSPHHRVAVKLLDGYFFVIEKGPEAISRSLYQNKVFSDVSTNMLIRKKSEAQRIKKLHRDMLSLPIDPAAMRSEHIASTRHDCLEFAEKITLPVTVIVGDRDHLAPMRYVRRLMDNLANADIKIIRGAGHLAHHENSNEMSLAISHVLENLPKLPQRKKHAKN